MPSLAPLRRFASCRSINGALSSTALSSATPPAKKKLVFLGSPQVAASVLDELLTVSRAPNADFQVSAVVTQPPAPRDRGRKLMPSAVAQLALDNGFPPELIFTPEKAGDANFLSDLRDLNPDLCVTASYGNILPRKFLEIPEHGTVNIHPSLLPQYRGAAPVQRSLQDGVTETGVSLAYTVRTLDAGPIIAYEKTVVDEFVKAPELLVILFNLGTQLLLRELHAILDGSAKLKAQPQDDSKATLAPKLTSEESWLSFDEEEALKLHNKVRAFAGWPGTRARIQIANAVGGGDVLEVKIITTKVCAGFDEEGQDEILYSGSSLLIPCAKRSWLEVSELQLPGKKLTTARDFWNGLRGQKLQKFVPAQVPI